MGYTPLPDHIFHKSPVKQVVATVLIAIFLGIGGAYAMNRAAPAPKSGAHTPAVVTTISPSNIPTALPTEEIVPTAFESVQEAQSCPAGTIKVCQAGECECLPQ